MTQLFLAIFTKFTERVGLDWQRWSCKLVRNAFLPRLARCAGLFAEAMLLKSCSQILQKACMKAGTFLRLVLSLPIIPEYYELSRFSFGSAIEPNGKNAAPSPFRAA